MSVDAVPKVGLGSALSVALVGLKGHQVEVQADIGGGLPGMTLLGLPDTSLNEARDRVRAAARNAGVPLSAQRVVVNLVPAGLPKRGPGFDVAILVAALAAARKLVSAPGMAYLGELGLDGSLRPFAGTLPAVVQARELGMRAVVVPEANVEEARLVSRIQVHGYDHISRLLIDLGADASQVRVPRPGDREEPWRHGEARAKSASSPKTEPRNGTASESADAPDLAEVRGQATGRWALEVAAAGGHHLLLTGPPGAGKTMLAERLPGLLPPLTPEESMLATSVHSLSGANVAGLMTMPPFQAPHHTASAVALVGGGSGIPRPGAASRAHGGVLFLDEAPEFPARTLDALREPLESGGITLHRSAGTATYPARFQLVMAANPCPCGKPGIQCECPALTKRRYWARMSGPLLDRVDLRVNVPAVNLTSLVTDTAEESSAMVRERVIAARSAARQRWSSYLENTASEKTTGQEAGNGKALDHNGAVPGSVLRSSRFKPRGAAEQELLAVAAEAGLTGRGLDRVLRIAWTLADLAGHTEPRPEDIAAATHLRGTPEAFA